MNHRQAKKDLKKALLSELIQYFKYLDYEMDPRAAITYRMEVEKLRWRKGKRRANAMTNYIMAISKMQMQAIESRQKGRE